MEIAPGVYSLGQEEGGRVHAFLLEDQGELTLIDTLFDVDAHRVVEQIRQLGHSVADLRHIAITHGHRSHLGGLAALKRLSGAVVYAHEWEADIIGGERKAQGIGVVPGPPYQAYVLQLGLTFGLKPHPPCRVDRCVEDGDRIGPLEVVHAAGHSPGHLAFYWADRRTLFAGDALATWPYLSPGWPKFNLNPEQHRDSLFRMSELEAEVVGVGHGEPIRRDGRLVVRRLAEQA